PRLSRLEPDVQPQSLAAQAFQTRFQADFPALQTGRPAHPADPSRAHALQPDGLPDAGRPRIPDGVRVQLPILLAARLGEILRIVLGTDRDRLRALCREEIRDVRLEGRVAAFVPGDDEAIDPDPAGIVALAAA